MMHYETVIVGAGVLGLALARAISSTCRNVLVVEKEKTYGTGTSSRNSEVIHAGIYYQVDSLKSKHCLRGKELLYKYCKLKNIKHKRIGKLIVAGNSDEENQLQKIMDQSLQCDLTGDDALYYMSAKDVNKIEPAVFCKSALYSPSTGIFDSHSFMYNLILDAERNGATFAFNTKVEKIEGNDGIILKGNSYGEDFTLSATNVILASGLHTSSLLSGNDLPSPETFWLKGNYFKLNQASPFTHLIYPLPQAGGLGVHLTIDLDGRARFGPDTEETCVEDYSVDFARMKNFEAAIKRYWPYLPENSLSPDYSGIRPKIKSLNINNTDFEIHGPDKTGIPGLTVLHGIESPGLTASLSIAASIHQTLIV